MGLTLPGLLGRVFTAASNFFQQSTLAGDTFPSHYVFGDGRLYIGDGTTEDLTSGSLVYLTPQMYVRGRGNEIAMVIRDGNFPTVRSILEIQDYINAPIFAVGNTGGVWLNDNFKQAYSVPGPTNFYSDIYGHLQLGNQSAIRITPGPPGNNLTFTDATAELFQRARSGQQGSWTAVNATYSAFNAGQGTSPANLTWARGWTSAAAGNIVTTTSTSITGPTKAYPCPPNTFCAALTYTRSATVARSKTLAFLFYNAAGTQIGSASVGTAVTDTTTGWTRLDVQAVSPAATAYTALQITVTATAAAGEVHYDCAAGFWDGVTTSQVTAWNAPYVYRTDFQGFMPAATPVTGCTGNAVTPIVVSVAAGHPYLVGDLVTTSAIGGNTAANQTRAAITAVTSTSFTIAGTGNGAYTSGGSAQMNASALGIYDGAFAGDICIRSDGPANVVQRFQTNAVAGPPQLQNWVGDPRITSQPARLNWYGGNYLQQTGSTDLDYTLPNVSTGMLHNDPLDSVNRGVVATVGQWDLLNSASNAQAFGGVAAFTQTVRKKSTTAPYVSKDGMFCLLYGLWDLSNIAVAAGAGGMTQLNATGTGSIAHSLRDMICHARASTILPYTDSHFTLSGNGTISANQVCFSGGAPGVGGGAADWNAASGSWTFTIPADFTGGAITFAYLSAQGAFGGTFTYTGTLFSTGGVTNPGPLHISSTCPVGSGGRVCQRFANLTAAHAGLTVIGSITQIDAGGFIFLDCAYIEGQYPNMVAVFGVPRLPAGASYAALGGAGSYWNSNAGATGDADVQQMNTALQALVAEFDANCLYVDLDSALQKYAPYFAADGFSMGALGVHAMASQFVAALQQQLPLVNFRNVNHDYHDTSVVPAGAPWTSQGGQVPRVSPTRLYVTDYWELMYAHAAVNTAPLGQALVVDILKNGTTIFTTTANRPSIAAGAVTAQSLKPDMPFLAPGDYLQVQVAQVGNVSGSPGADLTVQVFGRKIPIP